MNATSINVASEKSGPFLRRIDRNENIIKHHIIIERQQELVRLYDAATDAATELSNAIGKTAADSGYDKSVVRRRIAAVAKNRYGEHKEMAMQLALIFEADE